MLDDFLSETSVGKDAKAPPAPSAALEAFRSESELAGSATTVTFEREATDVVGSVALLRALDSPAPPTGRSAWHNAKKLAAAAALGIALGAVVGFSAFGRDASQEPQHSALVTTSQPAQSPPASTSDGGVAPTLLAAPEAPTAPSLSEPIPSQTARPTPQADRQLQTASEATLRRDEASPRTSAVAASTTRPASTSASVEPSPLPSSTVVTEPLRLEPLVLQPSAAPSATIAEPSERAAVAATPDRVSVVATSTNDQTAIDDVLTHYRTAYETRNASAVKRVWPAANEAALAKAFANLESQSVSFYGCRTNIEDSTARASCDGQVSYVARRGSRNSRTEHRNWTFVLRRTSGDDWRIDEVQIR
jgi:hypothetical protein